MANEESDNNEDAHILVDSTVEHRFKAPIARSKQFEQLQSQLTTTEPLFLHGDSFTGKTLCLTQFDCLLINVLECITDTVLFERILDNWSLKIPSVENDFHGFIHCDNSDMFVHALSLIRDQHGDDMRVLVLDNADIMSEKLRFLFLNLAKVTKMQIKVIMTSHLCWDEFSVGSVICIHFPVYNRAELLLILALDKPDQESSAFYEGYVRLMYDALCLACRNLGELRYITNLLYPKYMEPITLGNFTRDQSSKLFGSFQVHIKKALHQLYLRDLSVSEFVHEKKDLTVLSVPYYTKFLIIASFLCSYNPPRLDMTFFCRGKQDKNPMPKGKKLRQQLLGPKAFAVERLLAIFYSLVTDFSLDQYNVNSQVHPAKQIAHLCSQRLLIRIGKYDKIDSWKLKCNASYEMIQQLAKTVRFPIGNYLYDFQ